MQTYINFSKFIKTDSDIISKDNIGSIDCSNIETLSVILTTKQNEKFLATNLNAIELLLSTKPSAFEGKKLKWAKFMWIIHNVFAHPFMQIFALFKMYKFAFWIHDVTVPKPTNNS